MAPGDSPTATAPSAPLFRAVANSTRSIFQLLRCINFTTKIHVQITEEGIRFAADHSRVMSGVAFLDKGLFSAYVLNLPEASDEEQPDLPSFQISLPALLETLQIFGAVDVAARVQKAEQDAYRSNVRNYRPDAFSNQTLGIAGTCSFLYAEEGAPFSVVIEEAGVKTTANVVTYISEIPEDIPFDREDLAFKIIMQSRYLLDSLAEIGPFGPKKLKIAACKTSPYLSLQAVGDLGTSTSDFAKGRDLLETFAIQEPWTQTYRFDLIRSASEAMRIASKASFRGDRQGVLSLQLMVEVEAPQPCFLDFRFVPYIRQEHDDGDEEDAMGDEGEGETE